MLKSATPDKAEHRLAPYTLFCSREPLSGTLGPPDYFPQSSGSAEESLSRETCQHGYKEVVEGVDEQREATFTLAQQSTWTKQNLCRYKEAIHKRLRAVNVCLVRKLKIGQVYGVALSGPMLHKPGVFPEQRLNADDFRRRWLDDLVQNKRLRVMSDHVPTGVHLHDLLELAAGRNFPLVRATWCIRVIFLNLIRHTSGPAGSDKWPGKCTESWTKEILELADSLVSAICAGGDSNVTRGGQGTRSAQKKQLGYDSFRKLNDAVGQHGLTAVWQFVMCLTQWHCAQGLLNRATLIEFTLKQLSERESFKALELLLPMALFLLDGLSAPQSQVHTFVRLCAHWLQRISSAGSPLQLPDQPRLLYLKKSLVEVARYFLTALPPVSTALDCLPLLKTNSSVSQPKGYFYAGILSIDPGKLHESDRARPASLAQAACSHLDNVASLEKSLVPHKLLFPDICEAIAKGSSALSKAVKPGFLEKNECKVLHGLDQALLAGDVLGAVCLVFGESRGPLPDDWLFGLCASSPSIYGAIDPLQLSGVMSLCEWAVSGFREHRDVSGSFDGAFAVTDMSRIYLAISVLSLMVGEGREMDVETFASNIAAGPVKRDKVSKGMLSTVKLLAGDAVQSNVLAGKHASRKTSRVTHNLIVAWLDQLDGCKGKGSERLQLLLAELGRACLFCPGSYVRMLVTNGILEKSDTEADYARAQRHRRLVSLLPKYEDLDSRRFDSGDKRDAIRGKLGAPSWNERRVALFGLSCRRKRVRDRGLRHRLCHLCQQESTESMYEAHHNDKAFRKKISEGGMGSTGHFSFISLPELKQRICAFLRLPDSSVALKPRRASRRDCSKPAIPSTPAGFAVMADDGSFAGICEGCSRSKRAKGVDGREADHHVLQSALKEEDWWSKQPQKVNTVEAFVKQPAKQGARGRPKVVRKTQGLAQLAATPEDTQSSLSAHRTIKGSCLPVSSCPEDSQDHSLDVHGLGSSGNLSHDLQKGNTVNDLCMLGAAVKDLHLSDRLELAHWLTQAIRRNLGKKPSTSSDGNGTAGRSLIASTGLVDVGSENGWQMDDEQFKAIVYLLHMTNDLRVLLELLLWLLSVISLQRASARGMNNRNGTKLPTNKGEQVRQLGEVTIMCYIRRFDTAVAAMDLLPSVLTTGMQCAAKMLAKATAAKSSCRGVLSHVWAIMKKYGNLASVQSWETGWRGSGSDKQLQAELEALKAADPDGGFGIHGRGASDTDDKHDDPVYMRLTGRLGRTGTHMKETVQRHLGDMTHRLIARAKDVSGPGQLRDGDRDALDGIMQTAQRAVSGLVEAIRQSGGSPVDPSLLAAAVAAVVVNVPTAVGSVFNAFVGTPVLPGASSGLGPCVYCARYVLQMHIHCISILKEVFGDHQSRLLEVALASEAVSVISSTLSRFSRMQVLSSSDTCDIPSSLGNDSAMASCMTVLGRPAVTTVAAVAAFVIGVVVQGNVSLERVVSLLRIKEGLEALQLSFRGSVNIHGTGRTSVGGNALNKAAEANLYWFRVLIGNCRSVSAGLINALLGESNSLSLAHLQRSLPLSAVLPSAYTLFSIALQKQGRYFHAHNRDESILQAALLAANDVVAHHPFRDVCFSDTEALYNLLSVDTEETQHAASLDNQGLDVSSKLMALVPLRARVFLYAILEKKVSDCWVPPTGEKTCNPGSGDHKCLRQMDVYKNTEELVKVLDNLHPATFHWQWVELRLLLNEQVILEKLENANVTAVQALEAAFAPQESRQLTECEKTFTEIVLTRLLVRPDAAAMYSEVLHFLGQAFEEYLILQVKWVLEGSDMLFGRKSLRQVLDNYAHRQGFSSGHQGMNVSRCLPFGRKGSSCENLSANAKSADCSGFKRREFKMESQSLNRQYVIEKALVEMVLPCLVRSSVDACCGFGIELAKQLTNLEQHLSRMNGRHVATYITSDNFNHKGLVQQRGSMGWLDNGSPGVGRKSLPPSSESQPLYAAAIQASVWLRLQFLMPLLPIIYSDREQMARNIQAILTPVLLRLLDSSVLQEPPDQTFITQRDGSVSGTDGEWIAEAATCGVAATAGEWVFDRLLAVLHFISHGMPSALLDQEVAERMQVELDQVSSTVTPHLLTVMSSTPPVNCRIFAGPPELSQTTVASLQSGYLAGQANQMGTQTRDAPGGDGDAASFKGALVEQEVDPWSLLEDAAVGSSVTGPSLGSSSDAMLTLKATSWLRGAIRERRRESIYTGAVDVDP